MAPQARFQGLKARRLTGSQGRPQQLLGVQRFEVDARQCALCKPSRACSSSTAVELLSTSSLNLRTDNEAVFTSRLFCTALQILGIAHQRNDLGCPWQNGRIERLLGTLKAKSWIAERLALPTPHGQTPSGSVWVSFRCTGMGLRSHFLPHRCRASKTS